MKQLDKVVLYAVSQALTVFRANLSTYVPQIFGDESPANQAEITTWWGNAANQVVCSVGWAQQAIQMPGIWAILLPAQEPDDAELAQWGYLATTGTQRTYAIPTREAVSLVCASPNQNQVLWLQALVKWALYVQRPVLETGWGLLMQRLAAGSLEPYADSLHDVVWPFRRVWTLSCLYYDQYEPLPPEAVTAVSVTPEVNP